MNSNYEESLRRACVTFDGEAAMKWVRETYTPADVFGAKEVRKFVCECYPPESVFNRSVLEEWARLNGYVKEGGAP